MTRRWIVGVAVVVVACSNSKPAPPPPPPAPAPVPAPVKPGPKPVAIAMSFRAAIALLDDGSLRAWGNGQFGLLGKGKSADAATPIVVPGVTGADALEAGSGMPLACAHLRAGGWSCWGDESDLPGGRDRVREPAVVPAFERMRALRICGGFGCGVQDDGHVACWGQIPPARGDETPKPLTPIAGLHDVTAISCLVDTACAIEADGSVWCWGDDGQGQASATTAPPDYKRIVALPRRIPDLDDAVEIAVGVGTVCARHKTGDLACWGSEFKALGLARVPSAPDSHLVGAVLEPCDLSAAGELHCLFTRRDWHPPPNVAALAFDDDSSCTIGTDQQLRCWGKNDLGQLGDGTLVSRDTPEVVKSLVDVAPQIAPKLPPQPDAHTPPWDERPADCAYDADLEFASTALPGGFHVEAAYAREGELLEIALADHPIVLAQVGHPLMEYGAQRSIRIILSSTEKGRFPAAYLPKGKSAEIIVGGPHAYASSWQDKWKLSGAVEVTRLDTWVCGKIDVKGPGGRIRGRFAALAVRESL